MRLVHYRTPRPSSDGRSRIALARDDSDESPLIDLERARRRLELPVSEFPRGGTILELIQLRPSRLRALTRATRKLFASLPSLEARARRSLLVSREGLQYLPPIPSPEKIICIGQNYRDHCEEQGAPIPESPVIFSKFVPSLIGHEGKVVLPRISEKVDFEAELAFVIGKTARHVPAKRALEYVGGYLPFNDISARDLQYADRQWVRGKSCETFAPCGPALVTRDEVPDPHRLRIGLDLDGQTMQDSSTGEMIFRIPFLVEFLSRAFTLRPGDIVSTGTPPGVGCFRDPPIFLRPGQTVTVWIENLGRLTSSVLAEKGRRRPR